MAAAACTPRLSRRSDVASPKTPLDFLSPTTRSLRKKGPVALSTHTGTLAENDDEAEKRQRLLTRVTSLAIQSPGSGSTTPVSRLNSAETGHAPSGSTGLTNVQLKDLYSNCLKLSTENKINAKNAFGLHLIDYMQEFLTNMDKDQGVTNFQIASCTLDAGAKIYAGRVDSIHAQAYKMLGGLGRAENGPEGDDEPGSGDGPDDEGQRAKKKKTHKAARTIETNLKNINVDQFDLEFEVDPLFHKTSASFDEGGTQGLLLNHLSCRDDSCEILLDSNIVTTPTMADFSWGTSDTLDLTELREMQKRISSQSLQICPQFSDFCFTNWDKNAAINEEREATSNEHAFDMDAPAMDGPVNDYGDMPGGFSDDDGADDGAPSNFTMSASLGFADGQEAQIVLPGQQRLGPAQSAAAASGSVAHAVGNLVLSLSSEQQSEYSYFKQNMLGMWAGPEHWKNRAQLNNLKELGKPGTKPKKTGTRKPPFRIDFNATHDFDKLFSEGKASIVLSKGTIDKRYSGLNTLPENLCYDHNTLLKLFLKPKLLVRRQYGVQTEVTDDGNGADWYDYDNQNDCANYCPDVQNDDAGDDDDDGCGGDTVVFRGDLSQEMSQETLGSFNINETVFHGDNLVAQPNRVQKIDIGYAKTAKKIDVKKLKKGMWDIMVERLSDQELQNDKENVPAPNEILDKENMISKPCSFTSLYHKIPQKISKNMAKSLSVPIAFVCLLHLANEKTLKILGEASMKDLNIAQGM